MEPHKFDFVNGHVRPRRFRLGYMPDKAAQQTALTAAGQADIDLYDLLAEALTAGMAASGYGIEHAYKAISSIPKIALDGLKADDMTRVNDVRKTSGKRNPLLPVSDRPSPITHAYLVSRRLKKIGGNVLQGVSSAMSAAPLPTAVNIPGTIYHAHALALTGIHAARIEYIARRYAQASYSNAALVRDWCALIRTTKAIKASLRVTQLAGSVIPLASIPTAIAAAVAKMGIKLTITGACYAAAAHLQYIAWSEQGLLPVARHSQPARRGETEAPWASRPGRPAPTGRFPRETFIPSLRTIPELPPPGVGMSGRAGRSLRSAGDVVGSGGGVGSGPATEIIWELFTKRGATRLLGKYDVQALIEEPAGWMAIADKLLLI